MSTVEFFDLLRNVAELKVLVCDSIDTRSRYIMNSKNIKTYKVPYYITMNYPIMDIKNYRKLIEWADIVWITDIEYLIAPHIKRLREMPIVAHLRSYALICPWWGALYGFKEVCLSKCTPWRITRCKQGINLELAKMESLSRVKASIYWLLDLAKGPLDYFKWTRLLHGVVDSIDGFIPVSKALWEIHTSHTPELNDKPFKVIYNLVREPLRYIKPDPNESYENYILYASGSNPFKGPHILLEAWSRISKEFSDLKLYMVGCKGTWIERLAKKLRVKNVVFLERLPPSKQYYYVMYKAKSVVVPSLWPEPFGRIPIEANRLGVPAVVTDRCGLPEIVENDITGVVSNTDSESLADAIINSLSRKWSRSEIIERISQLISPKLIINELLKFFEELLK